MVRYDWMTGDIEQQFLRTDRGGSRCLTGEDWAAGRKATGICYGYDWVYPERENRTKQDWPYSYSDHFLWKTKDKDALKTASAEYSDRMSQWDHEKFQQACALGPKTQFTYWGKKDVEKFLTEYHGKPIEALALSEGCNVSNGYPYWVFWFREKAKK